MELVVDANVLFSALIKQDITAEILLDLSLNIYSPEFILEEFEKHKQEILSKTKRTEEEFRGILDILKKIITLVPAEEFEDYLKESKEISPDPKDTAYLALALKLNSPIWSNDKKLKEQVKIKIYSTKELADELDSG